MKELAVFFFVIASILGLIRSWMTFNLDRIILNNPPKSFIGFFIHDLGNNYDLLIEPIFKKFDSEMANNYKCRVNMVTYMIYLALILAIVCCII